MEFSEKLQALRKQKGITQEELAQALYVSRTAISKWESGRGYPSIDSLKAISKFFLISIDDLLSGEEILTIAQEEKKQSAQLLVGRAFGLLDCSAALFLFLPIFGQKAAGVVQSVSLPALTGIQPYMKAVYLLFVFFTVVLGAVSLAVPNGLPAGWAKQKQGLSLLLGAAGVLLFIIGMQPYPAAAAFVFLLIKAWMLQKTR